MRFNLNGVRIEGQAETFFNDFLGKGFPVFLRIGDGVRVVVAHGAVHLGQNRDRFNGFDGALQTHRHVSPFFADRRRGGRLTVRAGKHRHIGPAVSIFNQCLMNLTQEFNQFFAAFAEHQSVGRVVDVFARAAEVNKLTGAGELFVVRDLFFNPVLNRLDVMVGRFFNVFNLLAGLDGEVFHQAAQISLAMIGQVIQFRQLSFR